MSEERLQEIRKLSEEYEDSFDFEDRYSYICPGPLPGFDGGWDRSLIGKSVCVAKCLRFPDCICEAYRAAVATESDIDMFRHRREIFEEAERVE